MKERPILFSGEMVKAILDGRKTQTRRIMKPQPHPKFLARGLVAATPQWPHQDGVRFFMADGLSELVPCPHGKPGDRLWVRETWAGDDLCGYVYRADHPDADLARGDLDDGEQTIRRWHPAIHMRRDASRIDLEIAGVRVERLQDITEADILAEGVTVDVAAKMTGIPWSSLPTLHHGWREGWNMINGKRASWESNPWVWVIGFKRIETEARAA